MLHRCADVIWDRVDGTMTLCHLGTGQLMRLNETGSLLWEACEASTVDELVERLTALYPEESKELVAEAVSAFVVSLAEAELIELRDSTP
ncbi:MAG TPA: PqqD family protein [Actinomycetes bacterium]